MIREQFTSVPDQIAINGRNRPTSLAWQSPDQSVTWGEYASSVEASANALIALGLAKGDRVAMLIGSSIWTWTHAFGVQRAGGVLAPLNTMLRPEAVATMLVDSGASILIISPEWVELASASLKLLPPDADPPQLLTKDGALEDSINLTSLAAQASTDPPAITLRPEDPANIIYSSGTTGLPKGIVHSHRARAHTAAVAATIFRTSATCRTLLTTPPHTNGSFMVILPTLWVGGMTYVSPGFTPDRYLDEVAQVRPTLAFMVPAMAALLVDHPRAAKVDWSSFDFIVTAGAPMPEPLKIKTREMTGERLGELWGLTEGVATILQPHEMADNMDSVGRPVMTCEIRVVDQGTGEEVASGEEGELVGRSALMMSGYHNRPDANAEIVWSSAEGVEFLRTGDVGIIDPDGWIKLRGRAKDMLISGGLNVFPVDIEAVLVAHDDVFDAAVIGVPSKRWGQSPVGFVIPAEGAVLDDGEVRAWVNDRLAKHQRVHEIVFVEELPRNTLGKVVKPELAELYDRS